MLFQSDFCFMRKDLRFRLRSFEFRRCGKVDKKAITALRRAAWYVMCWSPYKTFIHLRHHKNGQRLAGNVAKPDKSRTRT